LNILYLEPFYTGSHKQWIDYYKKKSRHKITILGLSGKKWKWRMHGGAITLAKKFNKLNMQFDLIICSDMLNLPIFKSLCANKIQNTKVAMYFHENQLSYPWPPNDPDPKLKRDLHYAFINYTSSLVSDYNFFNSKYHLNIYMKDLKGYLNKMPDLKNKETINTIKKKSSVLHIGCNLKGVPIKKIKYNKTPIILWNHRWEYDKNPNDFFNTLFKINNKKIDFSIVILGEKGKEYPKIFDKAKEKLKDKILHFGYCKSEKEYRDWLLISDILPVTSIQDFFGVSIIEAVSSCVYPILPNRLAYPEILSIDKNKKLFYNSKQELKNKIEYVIINIDLIRQDSLQLSKFVINRYSWGKMAPAYDKRFNLIK